MQEMASIPLISQLRHTLFQTRKQTDKHVTQSQPYLQADSRCICGLNWLTMPPQINAK